MALTAREWLLLPKEEQEKRKGEVSDHESFLLRTLFGMIHFSEEQKRNMPEEEREAFLHPREHTPEEVERFQQEAERMFRELVEMSKRDG